MKKLGLLVCLSLLSRTSSAVITPQGKEVILMEIPGAPGMVEAMSDDAFHATKF